MLARHEHAARQWAGMLKDRYGLATSVLFIPQFSQYRQRVIGQARDGLQQHTQIHGALWRVRAYNNTQSDPQKHALDHVRHLSPESHHLVKDACLEVDGSTQFERKVA